MCLLCQLCVYCASCAPDVHTRLHDAHVSTQRTCVCLCTHNTLFQVCVLCVALAHKYHGWYNRSAVHWGRGWPNILAHTWPGIKRKAWLPHNLHISFTFPTTMYKCVEYVETLHNSCAISCMGVL